MSLYTWKRLSKEDAKLKFEEYFPDRARNKNDASAKNPSKSEIRLPKVNIANFTHIELNLRNAVEERLEINSEFLNYKISKPLLIGLVLYSKLVPEKTISSYQLTDIGFWRWVNICLLPDVIITERSSKIINENMVSSDIYYDRQNRLWSYKLWWGIHLVYQGDQTSTQFVLENGITATALDTLLDRKYEGYNIQLYRCLAKKMAELNQDRKTKLGDENFLRPLMVLHSSKVKTIEPTFFNGGLEGYVDQLINEILNKG